MAATKLERKLLPAGYPPGSFHYRGRPANNQGDFGPDVGVADLACVNQFGDQNSNKYYHGGVVQSDDGRWWVYLEWGRAVAGNSWDSSFRGNDFMFVECGGEADARGFFAKQMKSKNTSRLEQKTIGDKTLWAAREGSDGYLVQRLATRTRGLPDAYTIRVGGPAAASAAASTAPRPGAPSRSFQAQVTSLAQALVGGTREFARAATAATGITPTLEAIEEVRNERLPDALKLLARIGNDLQAQMADRELQILSKYVAALVPRPIPRSGDPMAVLLHSDNILAIQQDLDAFESALRSGDDVVVGPGHYDPDRALNAQLRWIDSASDEGRWLSATYHGMNDRRHANVGQVRIRNLFAVSRPDRDAAFLPVVKRIAERRRGRAFGDVMPRLQPPKRIDLGDVGDYAHDANVFLGLHGTRSVNVGPILGGNFRLPKHLSGVHISGAAFGGGVYFAVQVGKSAQYVGFGGAAYGSGGTIAGRGHFMFLCDVAGGKFHYPSSAHSIGDRVPGDADSIFAHPKYCSTLQNDEHVVMDPNQQRIRYLVEVDL